MNVKFLPPAFRPVTIQLTFETQEELDAFGQLCNFAPLCDVLSQKCLPSYIAMENAGANINFNASDLEKRFFNHPWFRANKHLIP